MIPVVVGEIVAGMLVGESGLGVVEPNVVLTVLADLGFVYLMFLSGLEISVSEITSGNARNTRGIRGRLAHPFVLGGVLFSMALLLSGLAALYLRSEELVSDPWIMALILSTTSLGVVVPVLKERGLTAQRYGQAILVSALVADFATILLISVYVLLKSEGISSDLLLILVLFVAFLAVYRVAALFRSNLPAHQLFERLSSATSQLKLRGAFALALLFVALAESLGVEHILGAFLAGVVISMLSSGAHSDLREKLDAVGYSFFIPIFFIMVGVSFELDALLDSPSALSLLPLLLGIAYAAKLLPALLYRVAFSWREAFAAGALLSTRLSLIIAASAIGLELGPITEAVNSAVILVAVVTCTISPILFSRLVPEAARPRGVLIVGGGMTGRMLAERLARDDERVVVIERDATRLTALHKLELSALDAVLGDGTDPAVLEQAGIKDARVVIATTASDDVNLQICALARERFGREQVVARINKQAAAQRFADLGVHSLSPAAATATILSNLVRRPALFEVLSSDNGETDIIEVRISNAALDGRPLHAVGLPDDALLLLIRRNGERLLPHGTTRLELGDVVTVAGSSAATRATRRVLRGPIIAAQRPASVADR